MEKAICLNCNEPTEKNFCAHCGQKTHTHRITLKHFLLHDLLHGIWHLEKGILFTIKEAFMRPGQAALDYISGKRIRYYNVFYLALLMIGLNLLLSHFYESIHPFEEDPRNNTPQITQFFKDHLKIILLSIVPILGCIAFLIFKRLNLNIAEHFIIGGIALLGILMISLVFSLVNFIETFDVPNFVGYIEIAVFFIMLLFPAWVYYNAAGKLYSQAGFFWRIIVFYILTLLILSTILGIIISILSQGKNELYINL